jgi:TIR domain
MADVFISYANEDHVIARELAYFLEASGYSTWHDVELRSGDDYQIKIAKIITDAYAIIVIWSVNSAGSVWVRAEATLGDLPLNVHPAAIRASAVDTPFGAVLR